MRRAQPKRGENSGPGKDRHRELDPRPGIREQPGSETDLVANRDRCLLCLQKAELRSNAHVPLVPNQASHAIRAMAEPDIRHHAIA